jgi:ribonuclease PH
MAREGGRDAAAFRPPFFRVGVNIAASGSSYVELGNTKVAASV